ncbi:MAG: 4Fe-4S binding protein [Actinomycetota bacterium]
MNGEIAPTRAITLKELRNTPGFPSQERMSLGRVAVIECPEEIPCNPCEFACPKGAIKIGQPITNLPQLIEERCDGCGICIPSCPGLAIFIVDLTYSKTQALVEFPHEFLPLPKEGQEVDATDRQGKVLTKGRVVKVRNPKDYNSTPVISLTVPKRYANEVRDISRRSSNWMTK